MDVSIIIVNYNSSHFLIDCLESIREGLSAVDLEVIVVDNASTDDSFTRCAPLAGPRIKLIPSGGNLGFSKANNIGAKHAQGKVLHFLNPDTRLYESMATDYSTILAQVKAGVKAVYVNPQRDKDGDIRYERNWQITPGNYFTYLLYRKNTKWFYFGGTIIVSREVFDSIGGWNEEIFMYLDDADFFYKLHKAGIPTVKMTALVYHYGGGTSEKVFRPFQKEVIVQQSMRTFYRTNHLSPLSYWLLQFMLVMSFFPRFNRMWWLARAIFASRKATKSVPSVSPTAASATPIQQAEEH